MPSLKALMQEVQDLDIDPAQVRIPAQLYDSLLDLAEGADEEEEEEEPE